MVSLHHKGNRTRLLSGEGECENFLTSCRTSQDLRSLEIRKPHENLWNAFEIKILTAKLGNAKNQL